MKEVERILQLPTEREILMEVGELIWKKTEFNDDDYSNLTEAEQVFIYIEILKGQVDNGGFDQYFFNSSGGSIYKSIDAYTKIGAIKALALIQKAANLFPVQPIPKDTLERRLYLENLDKTISDSWRDLETEFYLDEDNIGGLIIAFVRKNIDQFD